MDTIYSRAGHNMNNKILNLIISITISVYLSGCGGGSADEENSGGDQLQSPTISLTASPTTVSSNGSTSLSWSSTNATSCAASGDWSGNKATSGTEVISQLQTDSVFNLTCTGTGGSFASSVRVSVNASPAPKPTVNLSANPTSVPLNGSTTLSWVSSNADSCTASGNWSGVKNSSGEETINSVSESGIYVLSCVGPGGVAVDAVSVSVNTTEVTVSLTADPATVPLNGSTMLHWVSNNADSCTASGGWSGDKSTSGVETIDSLVANSTFNLSCSGSGGTAADSVSVTVDATLLSVNLTADPISVANNGSTTLSWESNNADSCTASGDWSGSKGLSGTETIEGLSADSQFTLTCSDANGSVSDSIDVAITETTTGTALLSWTPPIENTDGSALTDLAGYTIYYGTASNSYTETVSISDPGLTSYQIDNLTSADWYFVITAVNGSGVESAYSDEVSKTIN